MAIFFPPVAIRGTTARQNSHGPNRARLPISCNIKIKAFKIIIKKKIDLKCD